MSIINTGGPAFPRNILDHGHGVTVAHESGMTLRDYFAAKAPFPYPNEWKRYYCNQRGFRGEAQCMADWSYDWADAMLKAREGGAV